MNTRIIVKKIFDILYWVLMTAVSLYVLYWVIQITTACSFHTPSGSMQPTLLPDENGLVNKWKLGARIFNIFDAAEGKPYTMRRLPGYGKLDRGDVVIFNFPYLDSDTHRDSMAMNLFTYYCKRAVAVAGDSLEIRDCYYHVLGCPDTLGVAEEQERLRRYVDDYSKTHPDPREWKAWMKCCPRDSSIGWTIRDMGPLLIPGKGTTIELTYRHWLLYRRYIEWETKSKLEWLDSVAVLGGNPISRYTFNENYFFAAGDHAIDSKDSRYIGLVPEEFVVGTAGIRWRSPDRKRILTFINKH